MRQSYKKALTEVSEILKYTEKSVVTKVPRKFKKFVEKNKDKNYKIELEKEKGLLEQDLLPETRLILALMYRDYVCTKQERERFFQKGELENEENQTELQQKNLTSLVEVKQQKWYEKLRNKIVSWFPIK